MKKLLFLILFIPVIGYSQHRYESWVRLNVNYWVKSNVSISLELQNRRQSNNNRNILEEDLLFMVRPWMHYKSKSKWMISFSPISYYRHTVLTGNNGLINEIPEIRSILGIQRNLHINKIVMRNRLWYELRLKGISTPVEQFQTRLRLQNGLILPICKITSDTHLNLNASNEVFVGQIRDDVGFDHNRLFSGVQFKNKHYEVNVGYQWSRHLNNITRHQAFLNLSFDLY